VIDPVREDVSRDPEFPCGPAGVPETYGLALSGGGYRATLFHLGALWRLNDLGLLRPLNRISTVSGGSLMAGILATRWEHLEWDDNTNEALNFQELIVDPTVTFTGRRIDAFVIAIGLIPFVNPADLLDQVLHRTLTMKYSIADVPEVPRFVFNAANLATGRGWRFSRQYMGDSSLGVVCAPELRLSRAIAASAAYPPLVAPLILKLKQVLQPVRGATFFAVPAAQALKKEVRLLDGGAYDNLGVEPVEGRCLVALVSDAGGNLSLDARTWRYHFWWPLIRKTLDLAVEAGRRQRRRGLIDRATAARRLTKAGEKHDLVTEHVAIWRTAQDVSLSDRLPPNVVIHKGWAPYLAGLSTRMWPMRRQDWKALINWGYLTSDKAIQGWVPGKREAPLPTDLPYPEVKFAAPPRPRRWWNPLTWV
jgi:NTE family protein